MEKNEYGTAFWEQTQADMCYLSACAIHGVCPERSRAEKMHMESLYQLSRLHALTSLVFEAVQAAYDNALPDEPVFTKWREARDKAVTKNLLLDAERTALFDWMEKNGIWYLPLKGSVLKDFYPKTGMRQMADNDILFDANFQEQVHDWFVGRGYAVESYQQFIHDCYQKKPVYNFEMHTALFADSFRAVNDALVDYYQDVKRRLLPDAGSAFGLHFSDEDFYVYLTAHAYKHYSGSGTGLRTLLDFYVYLSAKGAGMDWTLIHTALAMLRFTDFEEQTRALANKLFAKPVYISPEALSEKERKMLAYYTASGTYGTRLQRVKNKLTRLSENEQITGRTKLRYLTRRMFPDREFMTQWCAGEARFLAAHRRLMPLAYVWRLLKMGVSHAGTWTKELRILRRIR